MEQLKITTYQNQRILTTQQLADVYETSETNIKTNFNRNKKRFTEGNHYFVLDGEVLKAFKNEVTDSNLVGKNASQLILWTEKGADRHCKILDTDKAWEQFDNLEETYFRVKEQATDLLDGLSTEMKALIMHDKKLVEQDARLDALEDSTKLSSSEKKKIRKAIHEKVARSCGGKKSMGYIEHSKKVYSALYNFLYNHYDVSEYADIPKIKYTEALELISDWYPDYELAREIEGINKDESNV